MQTAEQQIVSAKTAFQEHVQSRCKEPDYNCNPETPDSEGFVVGTSDGSRRVRAVFRVEDNAVKIDLHRPLGAGWESEPFEKDLLDHEKASFLVYDELQKNDQKIQ